MKKKKTQKQKQNSGLAAGERVDRDHCRKKTQDINIRKTRSEKKKKFTRYFLTQRVRDERRFSTFISIDIFVGGGTAELYKADVEEEEEVDD